MKQLKKSLIIHPFLFAIIPVLYFFTSEIEAPLEYLALIILITFGVILLFILFLKWITKDYLKSGIIISFSLILFIGYGASYLEFSGDEILDSEISISFLLIILFLIILIFGNYFLIKSNKKLNKVSSLLNIISIGLLISLTIFIIISSNQGTEIYNNKNFEMLLLPDMEQKYLPDIYYIILDEYAGSLSLQNNFGFDNSKFYSELEGMGFVMPDTNYSNYPYTMLSIPSTLNMQYLNFLKNEMGTKSINVKPIVEILENNLVMKNLNKQGYHIVSAFAGGDAAGTKKFVDEKLCEKEHFQNQVKTIIKKVVPTLFFVSSDSNDWKRNEILCTFLEIPKIKNKISQPIFVYAHMALPHSPFVFDENGNLVDFSTKTIGNEETKKKYLDQLKFTNKKVVELIESLLSKYENHPIILIQSDHGERTGIDWENPSNDMLMQGFNNLNAYYLPNSSENLVYDSISPVNSFRLIFNEYFNANFEFIDDKQYWLISDKNPYEIREVTENLKNIR